MKRTSLYPILYIEKRRGCVKNDKYRLKTARPTDESKNESEEILRQVHAPSPGFES